jgi:hypothetical protein
VVLVSDDPRKMFRSSRERLAARMSRLKIVSGE